jgi:rfaE bifunctional protein kinase chain/domain
MKQTTLNEKSLAQVSRTFPERLGDFEGRKIAIVGDIGLDEYVLGGVRRISPEAPVPVLEVEKEDQRLGLAANVAQNVSSLGGTALLIAAVGTDSARDKISKMLEDAGVSAKHLIADSERPTTRKLRVMAEHHHIVRVDYERKQYLSPVVETRLLAEFDRVLPQCDGVIVEDYAKGVLSERVCQYVITEARRLGKKILVDPNPSTPVSYYRGAQMMTPNKDEAFRLSGLNLDDLRETNESLLEVGQSLLRQVETEQLVITRGKHGMTLFEKGEAHHLPTLAKQVFDVTGAGDTVIAAMALGWCSGWSLQESCVLANFAAGVVVSKVGCVPCTVPELTEYLGKSW